MRLAKALRWTMVGAAASMMLGCGGWFGSGGGHHGGTLGIQLADSEGAPLASILPEGRGIQTELQGLPARALIEFALSGPGAQVLLPDGRTVRSVMRILSDSRGRIARSFVAADLEPGDYSLEISKVVGDVRTRLDLHSFSVAPVAGKPVVRALDTDGAGIPSLRRFRPGDALWVSGAQLPPNAEFDIYVSRLNRGLRNGDTLNDHSGYVPNGDIPPGHRSLTGTAEPAITTAEGVLEPVKVWASIEAEADGKRFEIILDRDQDGVFDQNSDIRIEGVLGTFSVFSDGAGAAGGPIEMNLAADQNFAPKTVFETEETVFVATSDPSPTQTSVVAQIILVNDKDNWQDGDGLDDQAGTSGASWLTFPYAAGLVTVPHAIYTPDLKPGKYDIVIDMNRNYLYDEGIDVIDGSSGCALEVVGSSSRKKWTVMVYMNGDNDLEGPAIDDIKELIQVNYGGTNSDVAVVVQLDRAPGYDTTWNNWQDTRRYIMVQSASINLLNPYEKIGEVDMGDPDTLRDFINWGKSVRPADHYALVIWDHGNGLRTRGVDRPLVRNVSYDSSSGNNSMSVDEIRNVLEQTGGVDLLNFDTCLMGMSEVASEYEDVAPVVVGCQISEPGPGAPYDLWVQWLVNNSSASAIGLGTQIVDAWQTDYVGWNQESTQAMFDSSKAAAFRAAINNFVKVVLDDPDGSGPEVGAFYRSGANTKAHILAARLQTPYMNANLAAGSPLYDSYRDVVSLFQNLKAATAEGDVKAACDQVIAAQQAYSSHTYASSGLTNHNGASFWFPDDFDWPNQKADFRLMKYSHQTRWLEFLAVLFGNNYRITFENSNKAGWFLYPFFSDHFHPDDSQTAEPMTIPGYIAGSNRDYTITEEAPDAPYTLWVSYDSLPVSGNEWVDSGPMTIKVYHGNPNTPIHTVTIDNMRARAISWNHWKVLTINPVTGAIKIHNVIEGGGF